MCLLNFSKIHHLSGGGECENVVDKSGIESISRKYRKQVAVLLLATTEINPVQVM